MPMVKKSPDSNSKQTLYRQIKDHVIQIECLVVFLIIMTGALYVSSGLELPVPSWIIPAFFLILLPPIVRVTNPPSSLRNRLVWGGIGSGVGTVLGGAAGAFIDLASFGLTGGTATLIGMGVGGSIGFAAGDKVENLGTKLVQRKEAFEFLYQYSEKIPSLANPDLVNDVLNNEIPKYDPNQDNTDWWQRSDLKVYVKKNNK